MISKVGSPLNNCLESLAFAAEASTWPETSSFHRMEILEAIHEISERVWSLGFRSLDEYYTYFLGEI